jgi:mannan endo-1,4-beta-mannosidase
MNIKTLHRIELVLIFIITTSVLPVLADNGFSHFITAKGDKLFDGDKVFRFISYDVPTLNYNEDEFEFSQLFAYSLPDEFDIRDVFETVKQMGGKVVRMYTFPVKIASEPTNTPTYVLAPGMFSEESFKTMDMVLALANEYGIRIICPLLNNWQWMGGRPQYAAFRGKTIEEFWTDRQLIDDFKATLTYVINRKNSITGINYKDDKAIMCWETGNELTCPIKWTVEICRYIKSIDNNHLIMDGYHAIEKRPLREESVTEPSIDIIGSHHYEVNPADYEENVNRNLNIINKRKPYIIGEFGFVGTPAIEQFINKIIESDVSGMLIWGLRGHRSKGGFYWHSEPLGFGRYKSYHWPGFESGKEYDETNLMGLMREKAYAIDGQPAPALSAPKAPELLPIEHVSSISWKGSTGASCYDLYRSENKSGPWMLIGFNLSDAAEQYYPLFNDRNAKIGKTYYYRLVAKNAAGNSEPSGIVGPVKVETLGLVDNMENFGEMYYSSKEITLETSDDRKFKEDMYRLQGNSGNEIIYLAPGIIREVKIYSFCKDDIENLKFELSPDNKKYVTITNSGRQSFNNGKGDYGYWVPVYYHFTTDSKNNFLKINFTSESQISRLEIFYQ